MTKLANIASQRAESWQAWKLGERESYPITPICDTLDQATQQALRALCWQPGDTLAIQHSHAGRNIHTLWLFTVKQSTKVGIWRESTNGGRKVFVGKLLAKPICQTALAEPFAPVRPFDAFRDDPVGRDLTLVEQR